MNDKTIENIAIVTDFETWWDENIYNKIFKFLNYGKQDSDNRLLMEYNGDKHVISNESYEIIKMIALKSWKASRQQMSKDFHNNYW